MCALLCTLGCMHVTQRNEERLDEKEHLPSFVMANFLKMYTNQPNRKTNRPRRSRKVAAADVARVKRNIQFPHISRPQSVPRPTNQSTLQPISPLTGNNGRRTETYQASCGNGFLYGERARRRNGTIWEGACQCCRRENESSIGQAQSDAGEVVLAALSKTKSGGVQKRNAERQTPRETTTSLKHAARYFFY